MSSKAKSHGRRGSRELNVTLVFFGILFALFGLLPGTMFYFAWNYAQPSFPMPFWAAWMTGALIIGFCFYRRSGKS